MLSRGLSRHFADFGCFGVREMPLANGRRADLMLIDRRGELTIVEIKVSRADLLGDGKWPDYLDYCDRFYWAIPAGLDPAPLADAGRLPARTGILIADSYGAAELRAAARVPLAAPRRKGVLLSASLIAARRLSSLLDPDHILHGDHGPA